LVIRPKHIGRARKIPDRSRRKMQSAAGSRKRFGRSTPDPA
jgi:hypothetical protein